MEGTATKSNKKWWIIGGISLFLIILFGAIYHFKVSKPKKNLAKANKLFDETAVIYADKGLTAAMTSPQSDEMMGLGYYVGYDPEKETWFMQNQGGTRIAEAKIEKAAA